MVQRRIVWLAVLMRVIDLVQPAAYNLVRRKQSDSRAGIQHRVQEAVALTLKQVKTFVFTFPRTEKPGQVAPHPHTRTRAAQSTSTRLPTRCVVHAATLPDLCDWPHSIPLPSRQTEPQHAPHPHLFALNGTLPLQKTTPSTIGSKRCDWSQEGTTRKKGNGNPGRRRRKDAGG